MFRVCVFWSQGFRQEPSCLAFVASGTAFPARCWGSYPDVRQRRSLSSPCLCSNETQDRADENMLNFLSANFFFFFPLSSFAFNMKSKNLILAEHLNDKVEVLNASLASTGVLHGHVTTEPIRQERVSLSADLRAGFLSLVLVKSMPEANIHTSHIS